MTAVETRPCARFPGLLIRSDGLVIGKRGEPLTPMVNKGYQLISVYDPETRKVRKPRVHVLVCETFHGPRPSPEHEVRHLNGKSWDNRASNLCWGTKIENNADRKLHDTMPWGERHPRAKITEVDVHEIRRRCDAGETFVRVAADYPISNVMVARIARRTSWAHVVEASPQIPAA